MMQLAAFCAVGAEKVLGNELRKLGFSITESGFGRVRFTADLAGAYLALISLRCADRILLEAARFPANDFDQLFEGAKSVAWQDIIPKGHTVTISKVRTRASSLSAETSIQAVCHKAVAETLCRAWKVERLTDWHEPVSLRVFVEKNIATLMLDISGTPLFRRGYRKEGGAAPLRETSAAALLLLSNWRRKTPLYDPFCGSGTFAIEAALYAWNVPVGMSRTFALEDLAIADAALFKKVKAQAIEGIDTGCRVRIAGSDQDPKAIANANANFARALKQLSLPSAPAHQPTFDVSPLEDARPPFDEEGLIITNPPWGERLGERSEAEAIWTRMQCLNEHFPGWDIGVLTNYNGFESFFGRAASSVKELTNGAIQTYYHYFEGGRTRNVHRSKT